MTVVNPAALRAVPAAYSHALVRPGTPVFATGQVSWDLEGNVVGKGDIEAQLEQTWANVRALVADLGATMDDVVKITTYTTDGRYLAPIGAAKARQFTPGRFPASTFLVVAGLADPDLLVEIEVIVMLDR